MSLSVHGVYLLCYKNFSLVSGIIYDPISCCTFNISFHLRLFSNDLENLHFDTFFFHLSQLKSLPRSTFFLISNMNMSGSPPQRIPPQILSNVTYDRPSCLSKLSTPYTGPEIGQYGVEIGSGIAAAEVAQVQLGKDANLPSLGLPALRTGTFSLMKLVCLFIVISANCADTSKFHGFFMS